MWSKSELLHNSDYETIKSLRNVVSAWQARLLELLVVLNVFWSGHSLSSQTGQSYIEKRVTCRRRRLGTVYSAVGHGTNLSIGRFLQLRSTYCR